MFQTSIQVRVRYAETDQMGYVYYGDYATYYEVARVEALRTLGLSYKELEAGGIMMPVLENHSKFLLPGKYDELLTVKVTIPAMPLVKIIFQYEITNESGQVIHTGETLLAFINTKSGRPVRMPEEMKQLLESFFQ